MDGLRKAHEVRTKKQKKQEKKKKEVSRKGITKSKQLPPELETSGGSAMPAKQAKETGESKQK